MGWGIFNQVSYVDTYRIQQGETRENHDSRVDENKRYDNGMYGNMILKSCLKLAQSV